MAEKGYYAGYNASKVEEMAKEYGGYIKLLGVWEEPPAPPPAEAVLNLGQPQSSVQQLLLRANLPSTIKLQGPADLLFSGVTIRLTAQPLERNLALPQWGASRSITGTSPAWQEILLAAPARIDAVGVRTRSKPAGAAVVEHKEAGSYRTYVAALTLYGQGKSNIYSGYHAQTVATDSVRFSLTDDKADLLLRSASLPSRLAIALGDDTPAQLFPTEMEAGGSLTSRDLTGALNAAWLRGRSGQTAEVQLKITSLTDGVVRVDLGGAWARSWVSPGAEVKLDAINPVTVAMEWPFGPTVPEAAAILRLTGRIEGGRRLGYLSGPPTFQVRTTERVEVAQAVRIAGGTPPAAKREVLALWLMLPRLPREEERLELRLAEAAGDPPFPADDPLAAQEVTLPADAAAYVAQSGGYWYRAALEKPVELDGAQATQPIFVVAAGREAGSLLAHRSLGMEPAAAQRIPAGAGAGASLVRNLDRTGTWEVQGFNRQAAAWLVDLELAPLEPEYAGLLTMAYGASPPQPLPLARGDRVSLETTPQVVQRPPAGPLTLTLGSAVRAGLTVQLVASKGVQG